MTIRPVRLQLSRRAGFNLQRLSRETNGLEAVNVARGSGRKWGNPWRIGETVDLKQARRWGWEIAPAERGLVCPNARRAVLKFRHALFWDSAIHDHLREQIGGKNVACFCDVEHECHGDPILWIANTDGVEIERLQRQIDESILSEAEAFRACDAFLEIANR